MRVIIIGCGRVGAGLAHSLITRGHAITLVDKEPASFERLGPAFKGQTLAGIGFDRDVLDRAGIDRADGLAAVTNSDDVNVITARLASQIFRVPCVVARLYDPRKAEIYQRLGVQTISTTAWGIKRAVELLCYSALEPRLSFGEGEVDIVDIDVPLLLIGRTVNDITIPGEVHVVAISRKNQTFLPTLGTLFQAGDRLHMAVLRASAHRLEALLGAT